MFISMDSSQLKIQAAFYHRFSVSQWLCDTYPRNDDFSVAKAIT